MKIMKLDTKKQNVFFTSDTHFSHANIIKYCDRPYKSADEMDEDLIRRWNETVKKDDVVFHLGDFGMANQKKLESIVGRLNGQIYLIRGNHDGHLNTDGLFTLVRQQMIVKVDGVYILMLHYPLLGYRSETLDGKRLIQLYGHVHSRKNMSSYDKQRQASTSWNQYDVGVDNNDYRPVSFKEVMEKIENRRANEKGLRNRALNWLINKLYFLKR